MNEEEQQLHQFSELSWGERGCRTRSLRCDTIDTRRQDNVSLIVPNKRASDFTPGDKEQGIGGERQLETKVHAVVDGSFPTFIVHGLASTFMVGVQLYCLLGVVRQFCLQCDV